MTQLPDDGNQTMRPRGDAAAESNDPEVVALRSEIAQTRGQMGTTIEAIQRKLDPEDLKRAAMEITDHAVNQVKDAAKDITDHAVDEAKTAVQDITGQATSSVRQATIGKVEHMAQRLSDTAREAESGLTGLISRNPLASAIAGIGLGWLYLSNRQASQRHYNYRSEGYRPGMSGTYRGSTGYSTRGGYGATGYYQSHEAGESQSVVDEAKDRIEETAGNLAGRAQDMAESAGSTAGDLGSTVMESIKHNPVPAALAGLSLGWLFLNRPMPAAGYGNGYGPGRYGNRFAEQARRATDEFASDVQDSAKNISERIGQTTGEVADRVQDTASDVADRVQETTSRVVDQAQETFSQVGTTVEGQATRVQYQLEEFFRDRPLAAGAAVAAVGLALGLALPKTEPEHRLMGEASSSVMDRAESVAQDTMQRAQRVVEAVGDSAQREAQDQGLAPRKDPTT